MGARKDSPPYQPRDVVDGKYHLRRVLGEGGMAVVYAATDSSCDRQVAIKILRPSVAARGHLSRARVVREAATIVKLHERTPHVVEVLTAGITDDEHGLPYQVMERLYGTTLRAGIEQKKALGQPFEIIEVASTGTEIATALAYAHEMGIVHRDIKPENAYLAEQRDSTYIVKLLDFGVSALVGDDADPSGRRTFVGSRPYAAPEQLDGQPVTPASDIYALGLILFEMLTFTLPHDRLNPALSVAETALNALRLPMPALFGWRSDVPVPMERLMRSCLAYEPGLRPNALEVARFLREVKREIEDGFLGGGATVPTDVSGPPSAVLMQRFDNATEDFTQAVPQAGALGGSVDLMASTVDPPYPGPPAGVPQDHEVFFMNPVASTERLPTKTQPLAAPPIEPQRIVMLRPEGEAEERGR